MKTIKRVVQHKLSSSQCPLWNHNNISNNTNRGDEKLEISTMKNYNIKIKMVIKCQKMFGCGTQAHLTTFTY